MRTQTIATRFDGQELLAQPVDPSGWLAGPAAEGGGDQQFPKGHRSDRQGVDQQDVTATQSVAGRRADSGRTVRTGIRSARRAGRVRQLRRIRTENQRTENLRTGKLRTENLRTESVGTPESPAGQFLGSGEADRIGPSLAAAPFGGASETSARPARSPSDAGRIDGYRMGRWARLTLTVTVLAAVVVVVASLTAPAPPRGHVDVTVTPGDTLWSIAAQVAPDRDPRDVIDEIRQLNVMQGSVLPVGVVLRVPTSAD